jgi:RimJ/RimL family protein N-acetyltransferase
MIRDARPGYVQGDYGRWHPSSARGQRHERASSTSPYRAEASAPNAATGEDGQMVTLTTSRLLLRHWREDDVPAMAVINADPEVMRWIGAGTPIDEDATAAGIARSEQHWETHGFGLFAVEIRATGRLAGFTGLNTPYFLPEVLPAVEIGWRLGRQFWGQGIATEAARAALDFGFADRGLDRIVSIHQVGNDASGRIMQKLRMQFDREITDGHERRVRVYAINRDEFSQTGPLRQPT